MFSFHTFKDKRYWILLVPYLLVIIGIIIFGSSYFVGRPLMAPVFLLVSATLFWGTYHLWKYIGDRKGNR
ncbi:hypothetical protein [Cytobacillus gottheilii]|uniref:hypothetical protein n=1 Tax=Cytobacillus gottheilii TaxID=859144 RepID=UPI0009B95DE3|nr:hypothetical protein [Cytobacillus gottheilii]